MNNIKKTRATRPDKSLFFAMMGVFFLLFALAPAYWSFYNYREYNRTDELLRRWSQQPEIMPKDSSGGNPFTLQKSRLERYKLEMLLSSAGSLILFGIALVLLIKSYSASKRKNIYEIVAWRTIPIPNAPIKIENKNPYGVLFWLIVLLFGGIFLLITYQNFSSRFISFESAAIRTFLFGISIIIFLTIFIFLMLRARKNVAHLIDNSGVTRGDGKHFAWHDFCGIIIQKHFNLRTQRRYVWRCELAFAGGETVWIIPNRIKNADQVLSYITKLPPAVLITRNKS